MIQSFEDLFIFQSARELCIKIYKITENESFASDYRFVQQIHAAAGSIMDNIAEGFERSGNKEFLNFLYIAKASCGEVRSQIIRAHDVGHITTDEFEDLYNDTKKLSASIMNFTKELKSKGYKGFKYNEL